MCRLWQTPSIRVPGLELAADSSTSVAAASARLLLSPLFHFRNPFLHCCVSLFASWDILVSILNVSSSLELFFFLRRLDEYLLNDNSSPVLSCHEMSAVGGKEKMSYCKNDAFMPTGTKSLGCSPFPLCFSFLVLPSLGDSRTLSKSSAPEEWEISVYLGKRSSEKLNAKQANVCVCSYRACCGKGKQWCMQRQGDICMRADTGCPYLSRYLFSRSYRTDVAVALAWKDNAHSKWYNLCESLWENCTAVQFSPLI